MPAAAPPAPSANPPDTDAATSDRRLALSCFLTLSLSILGSSVLPVPYAWARAGVVPGALVATAVAAANACAVAWLSEAAATTGHTAFDALAADVGGRGLALLTRCSLALLLFGTCAGDIALFADVAPAALDRLFPYAGAAGKLPSGRVCAAALTVAVVTPLSFLKRMRSLETAAAAGVGVVVALIAAVAASAVKADFPALRDGELPVWTPRTPAALPEAAGVLGFAFYLAPVLFPLFAELPPAPRGPRIAGKAAVGVTLTVAPIVYASLGILGAARYGDHTQGSLLANAWLGGGAADGWLDAAGVCYLAVSVPPMALSLRYTLEAAIAGEHAPPCPRRRVAATVAPLAAALGVALAAPHGAEKIFAATGALPVCFVCYLIPAAVRVDALGRRRRSGGVASVEAGAASEPLLGETDDDTSSPVVTWTDYVPPALVAALGVATCVSSGVLAVRALWT